MIYNITTVIFYNGRRATRPHKEKNMKKKLLLTLVMVIVLCSLFALCVSAKTITTVDGEALEVTTYPDAPAKSTFVNSTDDYVVFDDGFVCPSHYIFKDNTEITSTGTHRVNLTNALDFSFLQEKGKSYTVNNIVELDIPQGITKVCDFVAYNLTTLEKITFPSTVTSFGNVAFQGATGLKECVFEHGKTDPITIGVNYMFYGCTNLRAFSFPDAITSLSGEGYIFWKCSNLTAVHLPESLESVTATRNWAVFDYCGKMYFTNEPFTTSDTAPAKPAVYYFPENLSAFPTNTCAFRDCNSLNEVLVFGTGITSVGEKYFMQNSSVSTIVFLGDMESINTSEWRKDGVASKTIMFANANDKSSADIASCNTSNTKAVIYCASESDLSKHLANPRGSVKVEATCYSLEKVTTNCFCGKELSAIETPNSMLEHEFENYDCTKDNYCKNYNEAEGVKCKGFIAKVADDHNVKHIVTYTEGFTSAGLHEIFCQVENCNQANEKIDLDPIFSTTGGYSIDGSGSIAGGWTVNKDNFDLYNLHNEKDITFGILMVNPTHLASNRFLKADGSVNLAEGKKGAIMIEQESVEYNNFKFSISGFTTTELTQLELVITAYAYVEGEEVQFIQDTTTSCKVSTLDYEDASLYTVSYEQAEKVLAPTTLDALVPTNDEE